ncbi:Hypothetical predicted protein [Cloeon dipterum]|uniref:Dehydrogenase/reductase SDR family member 11 n=1 Tax=Cloeon dipterum TaxID=197152 RepID=A0A8S1C9Y1_9INSE|nr:Hypothetical predicted protein [Cloeon dipterum]
MERWTGRVAVVTGASSGIGAATARALAENGLRVVGVARRVEIVQNLSEQLKRENCKGELFAIQGDVKEEEEVKKVIAWTREKLGGVDILINNAGLAPMVSLLEFDLVAAKKIFDTNVHGLCLFTREAVKDMRSRGVDDGHIVHISSIAGHYLAEFKGTGPYSGSKHSVRVLTEALRRELRDAKTKIRVSSISPGLVDTEIFKASGFPEDMVESIHQNPITLKSKDIADAVIYVVSAPAHVQIHDIIIRPTGEAF